MRECGNREKLTELAFTSGKMGGNTLVSGVIRSYTVWGFISGQTGKFMSGSTLWIRKRALECIPCKMEGFMKDGGLMGSNMV